MWIGPGQRPEDRCLFIRGLTELTVVADKTRDAPCRLKHFKTFFYIRRSGIVGLIVFCAHLCLAVCLCVSAGYLKQESLANANVKRATAVHV